MTKLVLLPGMDGTGDLFDDFISALPRSFEVVAVRYPIEHPPQHTELLHYIRSVCPSSESFAIVAESFSTPLAIRYAAAKPQNLKCLIMCAGFATSPLSGWRRAVASLVASAELNRPMPESAIRWFLLGPSAPSDLVLRVRQAISSVRSDVLCSRLREILACDVRQELAQVTAPVLYIQARNDRLVRDSSLDTIKAIRPNTSVVVLNAPHLLLQVQPRRAAEAVANFVCQHDLQ